MKEIYIKKIKDKIQRGKQENMKTCEERIAIYYIGKIMERELMIWESFLVTLQLTTLTRKI